MQNHEKRNEVSVQAALYESFMMFLVQVVIYSTIEMLIFGLPDIRLVVSIPTALFFSVWQYISLRKNML